jgi:hypothetical protein
MRSGARFGCGARSASGVLRIQPGNCEILGAYRRLPRRKVDLTQAELASPLGKQHLVASAYAAGKRISSSLC